MGDELSSAFHSESEVASQPDPLADGPAASTASSAAAGPAHDTQQPSHSPGPTQLQQQAGHAWSPPGAPQRHSRPLPPPPTVPEEVLAPLRPPSGTGRSYGGSNESGEAEPAVLQGAQAWLADIVAGKGV